MIGDRYPLVVFGRLLRCTRCASDVDLVELPRPWIGAEQYVCGPCLQPIEIAANPGPPAPPQRRDMRDYNPATEPIPF